jgi:hypothetical protein
VDSDYQESTFVAGTWLVTTAHRWCVWPFSSLQTWSCCGHGISFGFLRAIYCPVCTYSRKTKVCPSMLLFTAVRSLLMFYVEYFAVISAML